MKIEKIVSLFFSKDEVISALMMLIKSKEKIEHSPELVAKLNRIGSHINSELSMLEFDNKGDLVLSVDGILETEFITL